MFTRSDLFELLDASPACAVSIFMPTHVLGRETRQGPIRLKNLLGQAQEKLHAAGLDEAQAQALLAPASALIDDYDFWQHQSQGLALFLADGALTLHRLPMELPEQVSVSPGFQVRPLLGLLAADGAFLVLTITADQVRLFSASRQAMAEEDSSALPANLDEVKGEPDYENPLQASPIGRPRTGTLDVSKSQVQGLSPEDWRKSRRVEYIGRIALALKERLASHPLPVVVAADAEALGHFQKLAALGPLLAATLEVNPETLDSAQLHGAAYALVQPQFDQARQQAIERFAALRGSGDARAAGTLEEVARAAHEGRVEALLVGEGQVVRERYDASTRQLAKDASLEATGQDLLDALAAQTLKQGGSVYLLPASEMPDGLPAAAAILRY